jgi:hypothetical protein
MDVKMLKSLKEMEKVQNNGRGVSCVRSIISYIKKGDMGSANATCFNENDKIRNYPEIQGLLRKIFPEYNEFLGRFE